MQYLKVSADGTVEQFPYSYGQLRRDNPNTSFPKDQLDDEGLASWGVYSVTETPAPPAPENYRLERKAPELVNGAWIVAWDAIALTDQEWADKQAQQWDTVRFERNDKLAASDWTQMPDSPLADAAKADWAAYRQELRDITKDQTDPFNIQWPTEPA